ncbi:Copper transport outer membrane protein, MctB [Actinobaculum suis]|uniref:Copper transport outer membrane protein, MctB n=1 Tax=Actinobaculum suis TaxID=1657 RepID=A0A1G7E9L3_9ACTO|nr:copper transporter [Actinobaculum suis]MDY5153022.1 copper transporter [Actinobaculum suis]SDE60424.1 Copper transport outer membrane protein, MctB [Actinobaculum suis]VDG76556.1 Protein of uncharacterised function (DUF3186) [Actinobaculum suis]
MVDFKYHVVSLVSVFLALAVGIILGAGPLQGSIGNTLTGQVDSLRESRDAMRVELSEAQSELDAANRAVIAAGEQLTAGTLNGRNIAIVTAPDTPDEAVKAVRERVEGAGGHISGVVRLTENYAAASSASYRSVLAGNLGTYIQGDNAGASGDAIIAAGVDELLRGGTGNPNGKSLQTLLTSADNKLLDITQQPEGGAAAIIFISYDADHAGANGEVSPSADATPRGNIAQIHADAFAVWAARGPAVAVGTTDVPDSTLDKVRRNGTGSTVDSAGSALSGVNATFATAAEITGKHVSLGVGSGASKILGDRVDAAEVAPAA